MLHTLLQTSLKYDAVTGNDEFFVTKLLETRRIQGVVAIELTTGKVQAITQGRHLVHGGCGRVFRYPPIAAIRPAMDGAGLRAGRSLKGHGIRSYHPTASRLPDSDHGSSPRRRRYLLNKDGYRICRTTTWNAGPKPVLRTMELGPRESVVASRCSRTGEGSHRGGTLRPRSEISTFATWGKRPLTRSSPLSASCASSMSTSIPSRK